MSAASIGPQRVFEHATVDTSLPAYARANLSAATPGGSSDPEIIAANVSRMCCFASSVTSSGRERSRASLIYALSSAITDLVVSAETAVRAEGAAIPSSRGIAADAITNPARFKSERRLRIAPPSPIGPSSLELLPIMRPPRSYHRARVKPAR